MAKAILEDQACHYTINDKVIRGSIGTVFTS